MFEETVIESDGIKGLKHFALYHDITDETIAEAKRVAKTCRFKDHFRSSRFENTIFMYTKEKVLSFTLV